jgi:sporulation protein YlmC with PRC-barrel domain
MLGAVRARLQAVPNLFAPFARFAIVAAFGAFALAASDVCAFAAEPAKPPQQAPSKPAAAQPPKAEAQPPTRDAVPAEVLDDKDIENVLGREIYSISGEDMGRIVDILVDHKGDVRAAIIDFGGFLGVGSRKIAVDWHALQFGPQKAVLSLTRDQVRVAPEYKEGEPVVVLGPASPAAPHQAPAHEPPKSAVAAPAK